ncbi:MAG TPA: hypothetical protein VNO70_05070 [Blastocatellia bacterium]|nr:hypothetical protein [Blastocatellia bacterium]
MKSLLLVAFVLTMAVEASGQTAGTAAAEPECELTIKQSPTIRGIRLGMTLEEALDQFPGIKESGLSQSTDKFGLSSARILADQYPDKERLKGVQFIYLQLFDNRIFSFSVHYAGPEWRGVDEFISRLSGPLKLPAANHWEPYHSSSHQKTLNCQGWKITASTSGSSSSITVFSEAAIDKIVEERREAEKEKKRQAFKP